MMGRRTWDEETQAEIQFYGSSREFERRLREEHPDLVIHQEQDLVFVNESSAWSQASEEPHPEGGPCPYADRIKPGSLLCCPHCLLTGFEAELTAQRVLSGYPAPERTMSTSTPAKQSSKAPNKKRWWKNAAWTDNRSNSKRKA